MDDDLIKKDEPHDCGHDIDQDDEFEKMMKINQMEGKVYNLEDENQELKS
jgi:hypothetical protein